MAEKEKTEGLGISGFTLGVLGIIFSGVIGIVVSAIGLIFCLVQQKQHKTKLGKVGLILNAVGIVLGILVIILYSKLTPLLNQIPA